MKFTAFGVQGKSICQLCNSKIIVTQKTKKIMILENIHFHFATEFSLLELPYKCFDK